MGVLAIEINDAGLVVADDARVLASEPGFASVERGTIVTGDAARARARRQPRQTSNRFWSALGAEPGSAGADLGATAAELAHAQLREIWTKVGRGVDDVVLVVPGSYRSDQLGLLLGLAQDCAVPVRAFVDAAVAASVRPYPGRQLVYVDAGLYRTSVTLIEQSADAHVRAEHALGQGLAGLMDGIARRIADVFVRATRFDPFAHAEAEQQLYDQLPNWLAALNADERVELTLRHRDDEFRVAAERDAVLGAAQGFYRALRQLVAQHREPGAALVVQVADRLAALPGLMGELGRLDDARFEPLAPGHTPRSALLARSLVTGFAGQVKLAKRLPWRAEATVTGPPKQAARAVELATAKAPTHVVYEGVVYRVGAEGLVVGREADPARRTLLVGAAHTGVSRAHCEIVLRDGELKLRDSSSYGTFVNESRVAGETALKRADVIRVGSPGAEIHVVDLEGER